MDIEQMLTEIFQSEFQEFKLEMKADPDYAKQRAAPVRWFASFDTGPVCPGNTPEEAVARLMLEAEMIERTDLPDELRNIIHPR